MTRKLFLLLFALLLVTGCQKPQQPRTPLARIDNLTLTLEEVRERFDTTQGPSQAQVHEYIQRWLTQELLYQEAVRRGLDRTADLERRLGDIRRQLAINALLEQEIYTAQSLQSSEELIARYYEENKQDFILSQDVALMSYILFQDRDPANAFRSRIQRGASWVAAVAAMSNDPLAMQAVLARVDSVYNTERTLLSGELWRAAMTTPRQEPTFPLRTPEGYYVLVVWKFMRRGEAPDLSYVRDEIRSRLAVAERQQVMDRLLENLRSSHVVQVLISSVPHDSVSLQIQE